MTAWPILAIALAIAAGGVATAHDGDGGPALVRDTAVETHFLDRMPVDPPGIPRSSVFIVACLRWEAPDGLIAFCTERTGSTFTLPDPTTEVP